MIFLNTTEYKEFVKNIELREIYLAKLNTKRKNNIKSGKLKVDFSPKFSLREIYEDGFDCSAIFSVIASDEAE